MHLTLHDDVDGRSSGFAAGLDSAHIKPLVAHVHILDLNGKFVPVQSDQAHSGVHGPLILSSIQYTGPVQPSCVCHHIALRTAAEEREERERSLYFILLLAQVC